MPVAAEIIADGIEVRNIGPITRIDDADRLHSAEFWTDGRRSEVGRMECKRIEELAHRTAHDLGGDAGADMPLVRGYLLRWLDERVAGHQQPPWLDFLDVAIRQDSEERTLMMPLDGIHLDTPFRVGPVEFVFLTRTDAERAASAIPAVVARRELVVDRIEREIAGRVCARVRVFGPTEFAARRAGALVDEALDLVRFFHPSSFDVYAQSWMGRAGRVTRRASVYYQEKDDIVLPFTSALDSGYALQHMLSPSDVDRMQALGLRKLGTVVGATKATPFQEEAYEAVRRVARGADLLRAEDRLVNAFVAVESLLLRNSNERIKETVARRGATILTQNHPRKDAAETLRSGYKVRSNLVHHGRRPAPSEMETVNAALALCWEIVLLVFSVAELHGSRRAYIAAVEQLTPAAAGDSIG